MKRQANLTSRCDRPGWTLVELIVVLSIGSLLLSTVTVVAIGLSRHADKMDQRLARRLSLGRLADRFREDVRKATELRSTAVDENKASLKSIVFDTNDESQLIVEVVGNQLRRTETGKELRHDSFLLPHGTLLTLRPSSAKQSAIVELILDYPLDRDSTTRRQLPIAAMVGSDLRWQARDERGEGASRGAK